MFFFYLDLNRSYWQVEMALGELKGAFCFAYLDDFTSFSSSWEKDIYDVRAVLDKLGNVGLTVHIKKSKLFRTSLKFLRHTVSAAGFHVDPDNTEAIHNFSFPTNLKSLQKSIVMAGLYLAFHRQPSL